MIDCRKISYPNLHFEVRRERMFVCAAGHVVVCVTGWAVAAVAAADDSCDFTIPCPTCPNLSRTPAQCQCGAVGASTANIGTILGTSAPHLTSPHLTQLP